MIILVNSVATSADGKTIIAGSRSEVPGSGSQSGVVYVFDQERETYVFSDANGNIGIGSAQPTAKLDVNGHTELDNINVSGASTFVGVSTFQDTIVLTGVGKSLNIGPSDSKLQLLNNGNTGQIVHDDTLFLIAKDGITFLDDTRTRQIANFYANGSIQLTT